MLPPPRTLDLLASLLCTPMTRVSCSTIRVWASPCRGLSCDRRTNDNEIFLPRRRLSRHHRFVCPSISWQGPPLLSCSSLFSSPTSVVQVHADRDELPLTSCSRGPFRSKAILLLPHRRGPPPKRRLCASSVAAHEHQYFSRASLVPGSVRWPIRLRAC